MKEQTTNFNQKRAENPFNEKRSENPFVREVQSPVHEIVNPEGACLKLWGKVAMRHTSRISTERCGDGRYKSTALR